MTGKRRKKNEENDSDLRRRRREVAEAARKAVTASGGSWPGNQPGVAQPYWRASLLEAGGSEKREGILALAEEKCELSLRHVDSGPSVAAVWKQAVAGSPSLCGGPLTAQPLTGQAVAVALWRWQAGRQLAVRRAGGEAAAAGGQAVTGQAGSGSGSGSWAEAVTAGGGGGGKRGGGGGGSGDGDG